MENNELPPRSRKLRAELPPDLYLRLEVESFERSVTPYRLASQVLSMYLRGDLIIASRPHDYTDDPEQVAADGTASY